MLAKTFTKISEYMKNSGKDGWLVISLTSELDEIPKITSDLDLDGTRYAVCLSGNSGFIYLPFENPPLHNPRSLARAARRLKYVDDVDVVYSWDDVKPPNMG